LKENTGKSLLAMLSGELQTLGEWPLAVLFARAFSIGDSHLKNSFFDF